MELTDFKSISNIIKKNISTTACDFDTTTHLFQRARVVDMDATALRTAQTIRTVRDVTPSVIVLRMNSVTPWWAV